MNRSTGIHVAGLLLQERSRKVETDYPPAHQSRNRKEDASSNPRHGWRIDVRQSPSGLLEMTGLAITADGETSFRAGIIFPRVHPAHRRNACAGGDLRLVHDFVNVMLLVRVKLFLASKIPLWTDSSNSRNFFGATGRTLTTMGRTDRCSRRACRSWRCACSTGRRESALLLETRRAARAGAAVVVRGRVAVGLVVHLRRWDNAGRRSWRGPCSSWLRAGMIGRGRRRLNGDLEHEINVKTFGSRVGVVVDVGICVG